MQLWCHGLFAKFLDTFVWLLPVMCFLHKLLLLPCLGGNTFIMCRAWGRVKHVKEQIASSKTGPRVGRAVSIALDLDDDTIREWFLIT